MCLIPLAAVLSITDVLGLTAFSGQVGDRHFSVLLEGNGFALFTVVSAFLLQKLFPFRPATILYAALWVLACGGTVLAGTKAAIAVVVLSVFFVLWMNRWEMVTSKRYLASGVLLLAIALGGGIGFAPELFGRFQQTADFFETGADDYSGRFRQDQLKIVIRDFGTKPILWLGSGFKQYRSSHPNDALEVIHNIYLQQLFDSGLLGLIAFLSIFGMCVRQCMRCYRLASEIGDRDASKHWAHCLFGVAGFLLIGLVYPLGYDRQMWLLLLLVTPSCAEYSHLSNRARGLTEVPA